MLTRLDRPCRLTHLVVLAVCLCHCGSDNLWNASDGGVPSDDASVSDGSSTLDAGDLYDGGGSGVDCMEDADCPADSFCSALRTCVPVGRCVSTDDCPDGHVCEAETKTCVIGGECGSEEFAAEPVAPNLLIVLDRSCSMRRAVDGISKWQAAVDAIVDLTTQFEGQIRWGLTLFPDRTGRDCRQDGEFPVPVGPDNEGAIQDLLTAALVDGDPNYPDGPCVTNIDTGMEQAASDPALADTDRSSYVLLVTDGKQSNSCRDGSDARTFTAIEGLTARGIPTYVIGFGDQVDPAALTEFATLGSTASDGDTAYYQANRSDELVTVFEEVIRSVMSCDYRLAEAPEDPTQVHVFFNDSELIPQDDSHTSGWDLSEDLMTVTLYGAACDSLRSGEVTDVDIVFGCPEPAVD